jgi:mRNA interferase MazF
MVRRGDVVVAAVGGEAGNKPRPAVIVQDDAVDGTTTVLMVPLTSDIPASFIARPLFEPTAENGLLLPSLLMSERVMPARRSAIGQVVGRFNAEEMERVEVALQIILGMARA